uniref:Uncharacterized protein n=1 Tax=Rhizophora mucronata TaxID=61149 RepID=A0A2P2N541_RHIMU
MLIFKHTITRCWTEGYLFSIRFLLLTFTFMNINCSFWLHEVENVINKQHLVSWNQQGSVDLRCRIWNLYFSGEGHLQLMYFFWLMVPVYFNVSSNLGTLQSISPSYQCFLSLIHYC